MTSDALILALAADVATAHRTGRISRPVATAILTRPSPIALSLAGLGEIGGRIDAAGGWELVYWSAGSEARTAWAETVALMLEQFPRLDGWALVGEVDGRTMAAGNFSHISVGAGYAIGFFDAVRLGSQARRETEIPRS
ncbi:MULTISPECIES: hypothetical protein [Methylopilaceae]|uniref:Uncharacterized protein n=3 Tax=Methylopilaceae TaxID=3149309 RepID=A0A4Q0MA32_9HYPH|nr:MULTISPECIES: hypothetical protein [Methylocystaceae]QZO00591.1 hypothetical protein K6K41_02375 [Chenggangzhangella methanolivorans]RXF69945.1 hypothetical protein EK403_17585 [Hansschlegelia zhihuaiae]